MNLQEAYHKLDEVRNEYHAARFSIRRALKEYESDSGVQEVDFPTCRSRLARFVR